MNCVKPVALHAVFLSQRRQNGHRACTNGHLTTADQSEIRKAYPVSV